MDPRHFAELASTCGALPQAILDHPWGLDVYKVGTKMFAIIGFGDSEVSMKAAPGRQEVLCMDPAIRPAAYLARAGWVTVSISDAGSLQLAKELICDSHRLVVAGLSRKARKELGL